jgi:hypothetical protein
MVTIRYDAFKELFLKKEWPKDNRGIKNRDKVEKKMRAIEKMLLRGG